MNRWAFVLVLAALVGVPAAWSQDLAELEVDHSVNSEFVTPHTDWATPYALGKTRVLFFVNGRGTAAREVIELKQRFDFEPQMVFWGRIVDTNRDDWHGGENGLLRMTQLLKQKWDAFVFIGVSPALMPADQQYMMLEAVTEGAGLVVVNTDDKRILKEKNKLRELPTFLADVDSAVAFSILRGRGVRVAQIPAIDYAFGWEVAYDEWDMRLGKAILWAAGKEPKLSLTLQTKGQELARATLPGTVAGLKWQGAGARTVAEVTLRRDDGAAFPLSPQPLSKPQGAVDFTIPAVRAGRYFLDVIARDGKQVASFASVPLTIISQRQVSAVTLAPDWAEIGQRLSGKVTLSGQPTGDERLLVSLRDRRGREVARQMVKPSATEAAFNFEVQPWFPMLLEVRATLLEGTQEVASAWQFANVVKRHRDQFNFVMWDTPRGNLGPVGQQSLAENGVTVQLGGGVPPPYVTAQDIAWIPYTTDISNKRDEQGVMKPFCWNDEAAIQAHVDGIVEKHIPVRQRGVFVYSLGDEIAVRGSCLSPHCLEAYRKYLQEQYQTIAALNASWGSNYASFADVQLSKADDNDEAEALRNGNFPRWFDRQAYQSYNFCKLCERFGSGFQRIDPESRCGFEGAGTFGNADDLDGFVRSNTFWSPYPGVADEVLRSIAPRDFPRSNWMGYTKDSDSLLEKYWRMVTRGCDSVWWWRWEVTGRFHGWLSPNLDPYPAVKEILRDTQIVRDGLGDLLLKSEMQTDGIGMLYSQPSAYAAKVQASTTFGNYEGNHTAFHSTLRDLGLNFLYFTDRQMRLGEVDLSKFKAIVLPMAQAMSAQEAELLRQYVRQGGLLIADVRPAIYDGHVKPLAAGQLDDVFGVKRTGFGEAVVTDGQLKVPSDGGKLETLDLARVRADGDVEASGGSAAGEAGKIPLFLTNQFGRGRAVLLNMAMSSYPTATTEAAPELSARLFRSMLAQGQVAPAVDLRDTKGKSLRNVELTRWQNGPVQIVSVFRHGGVGEKVTLRLPQALYVYDLKNRVDLGRKSVLEITLTPSRAQFFALSPAPLKPLVLNAMTPTVAPGEVQRVRIASALTGGQSAARLQIGLPDGRLADWVDPVATADRRGVTVDVPIAFNDPTGRWTVSATDLYTGKTTTAQFSVK
ncbi:MAG: beta-galactosidase trimerization domain-containing protein [Armatimonadota bacterium]